MNRYYAHVASRSCMWFFDFMHWCARHWGGSPRRSYHGQIKHKNTIPLLYSACSK
eukprot:UN24615